MSENRLVINKINTLIAIEMELKSYLRIEKPTKQIFQAALATCFQYLSQAKFSTSLEKEKKDFYSSRAPFNQSYTLRLQNLIGVEKQDLKQSTNQ